MCVYLLLHHGHHVECIAHRVEAEDTRKNFKARPTKGQTTKMTRESRLNAKRNAFSRVRDKI